jgi:hypothetical protein
MESVFRLRLKPYLLFFSTLVAKEIRANTTLFPHFQKLVKLAMHSNPELRLITNYDTKIEYLFKIGIIKSCIILFGLRIIHKCLLTINLYSKFAEYAVNHLIYKLKYKL